MVMGGLEVYKVSCTKCDWEDEVTVRKGLGLGDIFDFLHNSQIPKKCPKCNATTKYFKWPVLF